MLEAMRKPTQRKKEYRLKKLRKNKMMDLDKNILNEDNPIWIDMSESEFTDYLINVSDTLDVEKLLLARMTSKNKEIADWAARRLYLAYVFGSFRIGDENVCMGYIMLKCNCCIFHIIRINI